ncbi:hypothetical protein RJT34_22905 [Clitoria ternatea]|uniref:Uncharacterized protein n=1 Tax=Clitoria ternatea TaxID=43366 RepID=A0AAN9IKZ0_CLITE
MCHKTRWAIAIIFQDKCAIDEEENEEEDEEEEEEEDDKQMKEEETIIEMENGLEEEEYKVVEDMNTRYEQEDRVGGWKFPIESFSRRCHEVVNHIQGRNHVHGNHRHLHMYGVGIA